MNVLFPQEFRNRVSALVSNRIVSPDSIIVCFNYGHHEAIGRVLERIGNPDPSQLLSFLAAKQLATLERELKTAKEARRLREELKAHVKEYETNEERRRRPIAN